MIKSAGFYVFMGVCLLCSCKGSMKDNSSTSVDTLKTEYPVPEYRTFEGEGFTIDYPSNIMELNQDSSAFVTKDGTAIIEIDGKHYFLGDETEIPDLDSFYKSLIASTTAKIVYKAKGKDYCVVSGIEGSDIFYSKTVYFELLKPNDDGQGNYLVRGDLITMKFTYPESEKNYYDPIVATVSKSFVFQP
jgi:hypothetical protein